MSDKSSSDDESTLNLILIKFEEKMSKCSDSVNVRFRIVLLIYRHVAVTTTTAIVVDGSEHTKVQDGVYQGTVDSIGKRVSPRELREQA